MENYIIPDSPNWVFHNSKNVVAVSQSSLYYSAHKKLIEVSLKTGKSSNIYYFPKETTISHISINSDSLSVSCSDGLIRVFNTLTFQETHKFYIGNCIGIKAKGNKQL